MKAPILIVGPGTLPTAPEPSEGLVPAATARSLILSGSAPTGLRVEGHLDLSNTPQLIALPEGLTVNSLDLRGCSALRRLPAGLRVRRLNLSGCRSLSELPAGLCLYELIVSHTAIRALPPDLQVEYRLDLEGCDNLESLPAGLKVGTLIVRDCPRLTALPEGLDVYFLDVSGCTGLRDWPRRGSVRIGRLTASGCTRLTSLPSWLGDLAQLDLSGCTGISELPDGFTVSSWIDLTDTAVQSLPASLRGVQVRWRGVPVDERIVFRPESITVDEVLAERNAEVRRVLLERMGYEAFIERANAQVHDRDQDAGGERRLLRVPLRGDEDLVCVAVRCPSTGRQYVIRVPPTMRSCRQAAAWIAGYDDPNAYRPIMET